MGAGWLPFGHGCMRFLMLNWRDPLNPKSGGAERVSLAYLAALRRRGHAVWWFANEYPGCRPADEVEGIRIVRGGGPGVSIYRAWRWYRTQPRFDLVIDQHHGLPWFAPWWCGTHCVAYIHEVLGPIWKAFYSWPISTIGQWQERWIQQWYRNVPFWTPSESTRRALNARGIADVTVIPNGVDTAPLPELEPKPLNRPLRLTTVCRLAPNKRVDHAIQVVRHLKAAGLEARLTVMGTGEKAEDLKRLAGELGVAEGVVFAGQVSEEQKNEGLRQAHLLLHTSIREGWGLNVIEANAMGTPAVVYPVHGLVDSTVHGETGIVTERESPEAMAAVIARLYAQPGEYERLRRNAWERSKSFQWDRVLPGACGWLEQKAMGR